MKRIGLTALEEKSFENVDDGRTTDRRRMDGRRIPLYTKSSPMSLGSGELKSMQRSGTEAIRTQIQPSNPKLEITKNIGITMRDLR